MATGFLLRTAWSREVGQPPELGTYLSRNFRGGGSEEIQNTNSIPSYQLWVGGRQSLEAQGVKLVRSTEFPCQPRQGVC